MCLISLKPSENRRKVRGKRVESVGGNGQKSSFSAKFYNRGVNAIYGNVLHWDPTIIKLKMTENDHFWTFFKTLWGHFGGTLGMFSGTFRQF